MRDHLIPVRMAIIRTYTDNTSQKGCGEKGTLEHCQWEGKLQGHHGEQYKVSSKKQKIRLAI